MTLIHIYESRTAPASRRFIAQFAASAFMYLTFQGPTAEIARAKAVLLHEYQAVDPKDRKAFDLKGRLAALGGADDFDEDLL